MVKCRTLVAHCPGPFSSGHIRPPPSHARTYTRTTQGSVCLSRVDILASLYSFTSSFAFIYHPVFAHYSVHTSQPASEVTAQSAHCHCLTPSPQSEAKCPPITDRTILSLRGTNLTHAAQIPSIQNKQPPIFILVQAMHPN